MRMDASMSESRSNIPLGSAWAACVNHHLTFLSRKLFFPQCLRCIKEALYKDRRVRITNVRFAFLGGLPFDVKPRTEAWRALLHTADTLGEDSTKQKGGGRRRTKEDDNVDPYQV